MKLPRAVSRTFAVMDGVLKMGDPAPRFSLPDHKSDMVDASDLLNQGPLVVSFYRGLW